jgi:hypothetical protein
MQIDCAPHHPAPAHPNERRRGLAVQGSRADYWDFDGTLSVENRMSTQIPDDLLAAYVNGELDDTASAQIEQAIARDARLAQRVAQQRVLRGRLRNAFEGVLHEAVPQRLVNAARGEAITGPAQIIDLARVRAQRARRPERRRAAIPRRAATAIGASLLVGLGTGLLVEHLVVSAGPTEYRNGALLASGLLNHALNEQLASGASGSSAVRIQLSFHARGGSYCRTFVLENNRSLSGLACHERDRWHIVALIGNDATNPDAEAQGYRVASSSLPPELMQAIKERISGDPLDAAAEAKARLAGWH